VRLISARGSLGGGWLGRGFAVAFICYIHSGGKPTPHMEVLPAETLEEAQAQARRLLRSRPSAQYAELWRGERMEIRLHA